MTPSWALVNNLAILLFVIEKFSALENFCVFDFHHCRPSIKYFNDENFPIHGTMFFFSAQTHKKILL